LRKLVFILALIIVSTSVFASLTLDRTTYGVSRSFDGIFAVNETAYLDSVIEGSVRNCGSYDEEIILYDWLTSSGLYSGSMYEYDKFGEGSSILEENFNSGEEAIYAFYVNRQLSDFSFDMAGTASGIRIDMGVDEEFDWQYFGNFTNWGTEIYSDRYDGNTNYNGQDTENPHTGNVCSRLNVSFEELQSELDIQVNAVAKKTSDAAGYLQAGITGMSKQCNFEGITTSWTEINCSMTLDLANEESPKEIEVCLTTPTNLFLVPHDVSNEHYFMSFNLAEYGNAINVNDLEVDLLKTEMNNYYSSNCGSDFCAVPFKIYVGNGGTFNFSPDLVYQGGGGTTKIYNVTQVVLDYDLTGKDLDLSYFTNLKTPDSINDNCTLNLKFLGDTYTSEFSVTDAPIAKFQIGSRYNAKNIPLEFDGSASEGEVVSWVWDFGDNVTGIGEKVQHTYTKEGNYTVELTVSNSNGVEDSISKLIYLVSLEKVLEQEIPKKIRELNSSILFFNSLQYELNDFFSDMGFDSLVSSSYDSLVELENNFTATKNANLSIGIRDSKYKDFFNKFNEILESTPKSLNRDNSTHYRNYRPNDLSEIFSFSKSAILNSEGLDKFTRRIYDFNQNVNSDYYYYLINVNYFSGSEDYVYVVKTINSLEGEELIESIEDYSDILLFNEDCAIENLSKVIYCSGVSGDYNLKYAALADSIQFTSAFVVPASVYDELEDEVIYKFDCESGSCDYFYCGDRIAFSDDLLGINECDETNSNYCPEDCGRNVPWVWYTVLGIILLLGVLWINFYRGPGNFFDLSNKLSFKLFRKKLFLVERDKNVLMSYTMKALREGFNEGEIRKALVRKGWSQKQLDHVFSENKKLYK